MNEFDIIAHYFSDLTLKRHDVITGIGDDCALLKPNQHQLIAISTDTLVSGKHFYADADPKAIGFKSLAVNLSDLAAMGATPAWVSLALTLPDYDQYWLQQFVEGFGGLANRHGLQLIGGDMTHGPLSITVTIQGLVSSDFVMKRSGAVVGDLICVSGHLGDAALALKRSNENLNVDQRLKDALDYPEPRIELGKAIASMATSCIDVSDGLLADLEHICQSSNCGAKINLQQIPCDDLNLALNGGDDYELCFTLKPEARLKLDEIGHQLAIPLTVIGTITQEIGVMTVDALGHCVSIGNQGYQHFYD